MSVIQIQMPHKRLALSCTKCGSMADATCDCGSPYIPARERAAEAIAANPARSNVAIAREIGVNEKTVRNARITSDHSEVDGRMGLDGKVRRLPTRRPDEPEPGIEDDIEDPANYRTAFLLRVDQAGRFAAYSGPITKELVAAARQVAAKWSNLAQKMEDSL